MRQEVPTVLPFVTKLKHSTHDTHTPSRLSARGQALAALLYCVYIIIYSM
jgi:hypothetical protein